MPAPDSSPAPRRHQVAAVPIRFRENGAMQILLITSRETRRWIVPKGWTMKGVDDPSAAGIEACEEAGVSGRLLPIRIGTYAYWRRAVSASHLTDVHVYALLVDKQRRNWKEMHQRRREWFDAPDAAERVSDPGLGALIADLVAAKIVLTSGEATPS